MAVADGSNDRPSFSGRENKGRGRGPNGDLGLAGDGGPVE